MRVLIDTNVVLDVLQNRKPHVADSSIIWKLCETEQIEGYINTITLLNLVYIMRRQLTPERVKEVIKMLQLIFRIAVCTAADINNAVEMPFSDFEDAVQSATASKLRAEYIITRNTRDFDCGNIAAIHPKDFIVLKSSTLA